MNGKGSAAILVVLLAVLGSSYRPRPTAESHPSREEGQTQKLAPAAAARIAETANPHAFRIIPACQQIAKHVRRFYIADVPVPGPCLAGGESPGNGPVATGATLHFAIALVANPIQTHLPLLFDRSVDAIRQAAEDESFSYDSSWFPWNQTGKGSALPGGQERAAGQAEIQEQPGVLVFRRGLHSGSESYGEGLVVFVVAEQPTGGIADIQFENALQWIQALAPDAASEPLHILGPTFSGSLPSLARELQVATIRRSREASPVNAFQQYGKGILIYSGTTSSEDSVRWFQNFLKQQTDLHKSVSKPGAQFRFRTFYEGDSLMTDRFLRYLQRGGYRLGKVAIVSEDGTAFGKAPSSGAGNHSPEERGESGSPIYLYYPRDIATLRSAYEQQSIFSAGKQQTNMPSNTLRGDLSEPANGENDTVQTYSGQLTPLAQEAILLGITNILDSKHIEFVILRSSNSLDQLFLSEFLRRSYPSGRVVIDGSDLLFRRGIQGASLRGVMLLSPYPLLSWTQDGIAKLHGQSGGSYRVFAQDLTEGIYIAARELLDPTGETAAAPISDYGPVRWALKGGDDDKRPPTWILVVGHRQFWPLALLNSNTQPGISKDRSLLEPEEPASLAGASRGKPPISVPSLPLPGEMLWLLAFCLALGAWHLYCCARGSIVGSPRVRAYFAPIPGLQHPALIFLGSLFIGYLGVLLAFSLKSGIKHLAPVSAVAVFLTVPALAVFGFLACLRNYNLPVYSSNAAAGGSRDTALWRRRALWLWPVSLLILALVRQLFLTSRLDASNLYPTFWRSVYLRSGVSPLLPQVLLLLGLYAWFWFGLQGLSLFGSDRPVLPLNRDLPEIDIPPKPGTGIQGGEQHRVKAFRMFSREDAGDRIEAAALPLSPGYWRSLALFLPITVLAGWLVLDEPGLRSLGDRRYGTLIFLWVCLCIALILADSLQFLRTWSRLRQLLVFLDRLRLRRTLDAMKGLSWDSIWKMSGNVLEQRYRLISRQFESMRNLENLLEGWKPTDPGDIQGKETTLAQLKKCEAEGARFAGWYMTLWDTGRPRASDITPLQEFQDELATTAGFVMTHLIVPGWHRETQSLILSGGATAKVSQDDTHKQQLYADRPADAVKLPMQAAEEFFILPYVGFIQNTIGRIRSIAMSILAVFVAATLAISSYPFDPLPVIGAMFLAVFAIVGATVIFVYAEMHRDTTLSYITNKRPGELGFDFWARLFAFGIGPLIGLLTTLFPSITDFVVSWLQPGSQVIR